ncbi:MAG: TetR/AcrR family transcriptional regulator C-terminal domain-containing protein [Actinomycetota bacterium]
MPTNRPTQRGRPPSLSQDQVVAAAVEVGLRDLTLQAVADRVGVSIPGLYRYVEDRSHLEALVGDALAARFTVPERDGHDAASYLVQIGHSVRSLALAHDGVSDYLQRLGDHSSSWLAIIEQCDQSLVALGVEETDAVALGSAVANFAFASVERQRQAERTAADGRLGGRFTDAVAAVANELPVLHRGMQTLAEVNPDEYFGWSLDCFVRGLMGGLQDSPWAPR